MELHQITEKINELTIALHAEKAQGVNYDKLVVSNLLIKITSLQKQRSKILKSLASRI